MIHELKSWSEYFQKTKSGEKTFELRKNDRDFKVGDILCLKEWVMKGWSDVNPNEYSGYYTGEEIEMIVNYIFQLDPFSASTFGINSDYCIMSIEFKNGGWKAIAESNRDAYNELCKSIHKNQNK